MKGRFRCGSIAYHSQQLSSHRVQFGLPCTLVVFLNELCCRRKVLQALLWSA
jgi:hypothetical protein